jgi:hypothetical protein
MPWAAADAVLLEPQVSRCYGKARRRIAKAGQPLPPFIDSLRLHGEDLLPALDAHMRETCGLPHRLPLGDTHWDRPLTLYTRVPLPSLVPSELEEHK